MTINRQDEIMRQLAALDKGVGGPQEAETEVLLFGKWSIKPSTKNYIMIALGVIAATAVGVGVMAFISGWGAPVGISLILVGVVVALVLAAVHFMSTDEGVLNDHGKKKGIQHIKCEDTDRRRGEAPRGWAPSYKKDDQRAHMEKCKDIKIKKGAWRKKGYAQCALSDTNPPKKINYLPNTYTFPGVGGRKKVGAGKHVLITADPKLVVTVPNTHRSRLPHPVQDVFREEQIANENIEMLLIIYDGTKLPKGVSGMTSRSLSYHGMGYNALEINDPPIDSREFKVGIFEPRGIQTIGDKEGAWAKRAGIDELKPQTVRVRKVNPPMGKNGKEKAPYFTVPDYSCQFTGSNESISSFYSVAIIQMEEEDIAVVTYSIIVNSTAANTSGEVIKNALNGDKEKSLAMFVDDLKEARDHDLFDEHVLANMGQFLSIDTQPEEGSSIDAVSQSDYEEEGSSEED